MNLKKLKITQIIAEEAPMSLLLEADPSEQKVKAYLKKAHCFVAKSGDGIVGVYVLLPIKEGVLELMNIAVEPTLQGKGIGRLLLQHAIKTAEELGVKRLELGTGTFGYQLAFYQKTGFRVDSIDKDFFLKHYEAPIFEMGIQHKDMLRLALEISIEGNFNG